MGKDDNFGIFILLAIIAIVAFGGVKNIQNPNGLFSVQPQTPTLQQQINETKTKVDELKGKIDNSEFYGKVSIQFVNRSNDPKYEYIALRVENDIKKPINTTGWTIKSLRGGTFVQIPKGTDLYFTNSINAEDPVILYPGDYVYIVTGVSPIGSNFRLNKCSGYLNQFQTFIPYIYNNCPAPREENLSSIPNTINNDVCFDYINSMPSCMVQTGELPLNLTYECKKFIIDKINYSSCIDTHKNDKDFYSKEWRIYLRRSDHIWLNSKEDIVLYDSAGKIVSELKY